MNQLIITCGKTHSGKTTFAKTVHEKIRKSIVLDNDEIDRFVIKHYLNLRNDPEVLKQRSAEDHDLRLVIAYTICEYALRNGYTVIAAASHPKKVIRQRYHEIAEKLKVKSSLVFFNLPEDKIKSRIIQSKRETDILDTNEDSYLKVLERQSQIFEIPSKDEADVFYEVKNEEEVDELIIKLKE